MIYLIQIIVFGVPIFVVAAKLVAFAFWISTDAFSRNRNGLLRFLGRVVFLAASIGVSFPVFLSLQPFLRDFRVQGDGGLGMAHNALSVATLSAAIPCAIMMLSALALSRAFGSPDSIAADPLVQDCANKHTNG